MDLFLILFVELPLAEMGFVPIHHSINEFNLDHKRLKVATWDYFVKENGSYMNQ